MTPFKFHRDKFGVHVYYSGMNNEAAYATRNEELVLNGNVVFDPTESAVVPPVERISSIKTETQLVGYRNTNDGSTMATSIYNVKKADLQKAIDDANESGDTEARIRAMVALEDFLGSWEKDEKEVDVHLDFEFVVEDIIYPADDRFLPMRHYDESEINYFKVDMEDVARKFIRELMTDAGLRYVETNSWSAPKDRGTWTMRNNDPDNWCIEGNDDYQEEMKEIGLRDFTGDLEECRAQIKKMEMAIRGGYDRWYMNDRQPDGLTTGMVLKFLDAIEHRVRWTEPKIKTKKYHDQAFLVIKEFRDIVKGLAKAHMEKEVPEESA